MPSNQSLLNDGIDFDPGPHRYFVGGAELPSVTTILKPWSAFGYLSPFMLARIEEARIRGEAVHLATELHDRADLDEQSLNDEIACYLQSWRKFRAEWCFEPELIEARVASLVWKYAGTLDRVGTCRPPGMRKQRRLLLDIKSGDEDPSHGPQTAGYALPLRDCNVIIDMRATVYLSPIKYRVEVHANDAGDRATFMAAIAFHQWRKRHNLGE
jgi:hypothetical protein